MRARVARRRPNAGRTLAVSVFIALVVLVVGAANIQVWLLRRDLVLGARHLRDAQATLANATSGGQAFRVSEDDLNTADAQVLLARKEIADADTALGRLAIPLAIARRLPAVGGTAALLPKLVDFADAGSRGAHELIVGLRPVAHERQHPAAGVAASARFSAALNEGLPSFQAAQHDLLRAQTVRSTISEHDVLPALRGSLAPLSTWDQQWPAVQADTDLLVRLPPILRVVLGYDKPQSYAILGQDSYELRPTGGFIGTMGIISTSDGSIAAQEFRSIYSYDPDNTGKSLPVVPAPQPIVEHLGIAGWHIQDANWSPDFPTSAQTLRGFLRTNTGMTVDGVIAFDSYAVDALLHAVGPVDVTLDGTTTTFTAENWQALSTQLIYLDPNHPNSSEGKGRVLAPLLQTVMLRVNGASGDKLTDLLQKVRLAVAGRHILFAFDDPIAQKLVYDYGADGSLRLPSGSTVIYPVEANLSYTKIGPFIRQNAAYDLWFNESGSLQKAQMTLTWVNTITQAQIDDPVNRITGENAGQEWDSAAGTFVKTLGSYGFYERIYTPPQTSLLTTTGAQGQIAQTSESGFTVFGTYLQVEAGQTKQWQLDLALPNRRDARGHFVLDLPKQPGTEQRAVKVTVHTARRTAPLANVSLHRIDPQTYQYDGIPDGNLRLDLQLAG